MGEDKGGGDEIIGILTIIVPPPLYPLPPGEGKSSDFLAVGRPLFLML